MTANSPDRNSLRVKHFVSCCLICECNGFPVEDIDSGHDGSKFSRGEMEEKKSLYIGIQCNTIEK